MREASYDEASRQRFGTGGGFFGFGPGGGGLPWVFAVLVVLVVLVAGRLFYLQVVQGEHYADVAESHRTNVQVLLARRGTIYDRNGKVLAMSEECYDVYCNPQEVSDVRDEAALVAEHLGGDASSYEDAMSQDTTFVYLKKRADKAVCEQLRDDLVERGMAGVYLIGQTRRVYPFGQTCGQIIGMVGPDEKGIDTGLTGLEFYYNDVLSGKDGEMIMETGRGGTPIAGAAAEVSEPVDGKDLVLAIDVDVQRCMEEQVLDAMEDNDATSGMAMAMDPRTGEIIAACSTPYADLTSPELLTNEALNLKMVSDSYDPGSTFKVLTAAIGLESGTVDANDYFTVPPQVLVGKDFVTDSDDRWEYTPMNLREVLRRSSNVGAALIAQETIGADAFAQGVEAFGIGQLTGIDYPGEVPGLVRSRSEYDPSSLGSMAFGQGITFPMVQMVRAVGAIANGGVLMTPHLVTSVGGKELAWPEGSRAVSELTADKVSDMMRTVVEEGTGTSAAVDGYDVAAKTGTGEQAKDGKYVKDKYLASLVGFAPARDPEVLVYVALNETPYMSYSSAGPAFSAIMGEVLADMGILSTSWGM